MHKIDGPGHVGGQFVGEDAAIGRAPTVVTPEWLNAVQGELVSLVTAAGLALDKANSGQVLAALRATGIFQTQALGDSSTRVATTAFANPRATMGTHGVQPLPSGIIFQWGSLNNSTQYMAGTWITVPFNIAFPNACYMALCVNAYSSPSYQPNLTTSGSPSASSFFVSSSISAAVSGLNIQWFAIGS